MGTERRIKVEFDIRSRWGNYYSRTKEFNSKAHLDNYLRKAFADEANKIIGHKILEQ